MAFAENACTNGVKFFLNTQVDTIEKNGDSYRISTLHTDTKNKETFEAKVVINAAGVYADVFNNMVSENKLHITARKASTACWTKMPEPMFPTQFSSFLPKWEKVFSSHRPYMEIC